ncbi:MAG: family 10 glycosylhydrolase [Pirellulales bacterium]|nr:family 10 glycosylhydrolase [Pirellulales bacterium]
MTQSKTKVNRRSWMDYVGHWLMLCVCAALFWAVSLTAAIAEAEPAGKATTEAAATQKMKDARHKAAWKPRAILFNNDGNDARRMDEPTRENFLRTRAVPMAKTKTATLCYCTGIWGVFTHPCADAQLRTSRDRSAKEWATNLAKDGGPDTLGTMVEFSHRHGIEVFWSLRMNDTHDAADGSMLSQWKQAHRDLLVGKRGTRYPFGANRWSAADYAHKEVRDRVVTWCDDVLKRYDVDGLELDFFRHAIFFKPQLHGKKVTQEQCDQMTSLIRRLRESADRQGARRGRPVLIAIRVPDSAGFCKAIGLDVDRWMEEGLIDMLIVSGYFRLNEWKTSVEWGHRHGVPVFASLDEPRLRRQPELQKIRESIGVYRARALDAWRAGVDGIYLFNYFGVSRDLQACKEVGDPEALMKMDKLYATGSREVRSAGSYLKGAKKYLHRRPMLPELPEKLSADRPAKVTLVVHDRVEENGGKATLRLYLSESISPELLIVAVNGHVLSTGRQDGRWIELPVEPSWIKTGTNEFDVSLKKGAKTKRLQLCDLLLGIRYK